MNDYPTLQQAVRELRREYGETQQEFAGRMKAAIRSVARYETSRPPKGQALVKFMKLALEKKRQDLADIFLEAYNAEHPLPAYMGMPLEGVQNESQWLLGILALRLGRNYEFAELWEPYIELLKPVWSEMIAKGELDTKVLESAVQQMLEIADAAKRSRKSGKPAERRKLPPWRVKK